MTSQINNRPDGGFEYVIGGTYPATDAERVDAMAQTLRGILKDIQNPEQERREEQAHAAMVDAQGLNG